MYINVIVVYNNLLRISKYQEFLLVIYLLFVLIIISFLFLTRRCLSGLKRNQQLLYLGKVARSPDGDPVRSCIFKNGSHDLQKMTVKRRVGRPRLEWTTEVHRHALLASGGAETQRKTWNKSEWGRQVKAYM